MPSTLHLQHGDIMFRPTVETDLEMVLGMEKDADNRSFIRQWSREQHVAAINNENIAHFVALSASEGKIVGYVILVGCLSPDRSLEFKRIVIGDKGAGLGRDSVRVIKQFAFEHLKFHRLWLEVIDQNRRACQLYESEGFVKEGIHRESLKQGENYLSLVMMSILASEYDSRA